MQAVPQYALVYGLAEILYVLHLVDRAVREPLRELAVREHADEL